MKFRWQPHIYAPLGVEKEGRVVVEKRSGHTASLESIPNYRFRLRTLRAEAIRLKARFRLTAIPER